MSFKTIQYGLEYLKKNILDGFKCFKMIYSGSKWFIIDENSKIVFNVSFQTLTILNFFLIFRIVIQNPLTFTGIKNFWIRDYFWMFFKSENIQNL